MFWREIRTVTHFTSITWSDSFASRNRPD
jgi:hypothetical protein